MNSEGAGAIESISQDGCWSSVILFLLSQVGCLLVSCVCQLDGAPSLPLLHMMVFFLPCLEREAGAC